MHAYILALSGWSTLPAARFGDLRKNTPLDCWSMYLVDFVQFYRYLSIFVDFGVSGLVFLVSGLEPAKCERCK